MKKLFTLFAIICFLGVPAIQAQDEDYKDLLFLIIDGDLEKAVNKAEKFTENDKTKRDPVPYVYLSMAYFEISKREDMREDYPRAFREAIKNASKFARYDKENEYSSEFENYLSELKLEIMREARYYYEQENWRRSITYSKYITRIDPNDLAALLMKGVAEVKSRNEYQAKTTFEEAETVLEGFSPQKLKNDESAQLRYSIIEYAKLMKQNGTKDKAAPFLAMGEDAFDGDPEFSQFMTAF
jgi:hypothetical protein